MTMVRTKISDRLVDEVLAAQFGVYEYASKRQRSRQPPLSIKRACDVLDLHDDWLRRNRVLERPFGSGGSFRDVSFYLTDFELHALDLFFDGDPRRPWMHYRVEICARGRCFDVPDPNL